MRTYSCEIGSTNTASDYEIPSSVIPSPTPSFDADRLYSDAITIGCQGQDDCLDQSKIPIYRTCICTDSAVGETCSLGLCNLTPTNNKCVVCFLEFFFSNKYIY